MSQNKLSDDRARTAADNAVRAVMVEVQQDLMRFLLRRLGNEDDAADVLHDFYVRVLTRIGDVRDSEKLRAWMYKVLSSTLVDYFRANNKRRRLEAEYSLLQASTHDPYDSDEVDQLLCMCLYKLLPTLKREYAEIIRRADLIGESRESIARALGVSRSNLRVRLHRARHALRQRLEELCRTCPIHGVKDCKCDYGKKIRTEIKPSRPGL